LIGGDEKMDEELIDMTTEERIEVVATEVAEIVVKIEDENIDVPVAETVETVDVVPAEEIVIDMSRNVIKDNVTFPSAAVITAHINERGVGLSVICGIPMSVLDSEVALARNSKEGKV
jgi:hypothetical protein